MSLRNNFMFDFNQLNKALRSYDVAKVLAVIGNDGLREPAVTRKFLTAMRQSSCLAIQIEDAPKEERRDQLVVKCRELLAQCPDAALAQDFEAHVEDAKIVERGYREIFQTMHQSEIWKRPLAEQAWGMVMRAEREFAYVKGEIDKQLAKLGEAKHPSLDPRQLKIQSENGQSVNPDAVINGLVKNAGDTLVTLAHAHRWFEQNSGAVVLPAEVKVDENIAFQAGTYSLVASQWRRLEQAWDRSRLFKAKFRLREQSFPLKQGGTRLCTVLEVESASNFELKDRIALKRLEQVFFQSQMDLELSGAGKKVVDAVPAGPIPLAKASYLSPEERVAVEILDGNYCVPVAEDSAVIADLPLKAWVRGYAYFAQKARDSNGSPILTCLRLSENELVNGLVLAGLSNEQARIFIGHTTFSQGAADLFDAPLLKVSDGSYCFFAPAFQTPTLGVIMLSRISSLNRRRDQQGEPANDCQIEDKGKLFESRVLSLFTEAKIPAHGFKYNVGGIDYDCDVAALIDDTLFVFECKNRSLPMGHLPSLHYFMLALEEAKEQVKRIVQQFTDHPELVHGQFGAHTKWSRIVPVVLHSLPWSFGSSSGVYIYDASALSHLMRKGFTSICAVSKIDIHHIQRRHRYPLRKGKSPTAKELEREMENPNQLRLHALGWEQVAQPIPVSDNLVFSIPEWTQRTSTLEEQMIALGSSPEEAARRAKEMNEEFPEGVQKIRDGIQRKSAKPKVGRNAPCPCGSGKKFKKCCLDRSAV